MKYKTLITGKNTAVIDEFFIQMDDVFEVISTSLRFNDIMRHIKYFNPDIFVYCVNNEARENIAQMATLKGSLSRARIPVILIGSKEECNEFEKIAVNVANLTLEKPFTAATLKEHILKFMKERKLSMEMRAAEQEREEQIRSEIRKRTDSKEDLEQAFQSLAAMLEEDDIPQPAPRKQAAWQGQSDSAKQFAGDNEFLSAKEMDFASETAKEQESAKRQHILVVDDDPLMLKMLKEHLHGDYDVATAVSGKIALKFLERKKTNLILLDYEMPGENGLDVLEKVRANSATKDIPVIFLTGVSDSEKIQEALVLRPQSYLLKPINREKLLEAITKIIG